MLLGSFTRSLVSLLAGLPAGLPVALAFFNSTLIPSGRGQDELDISTLQGQRVVKLVQHTPPSITTTWAFFNLFEPLEITDDFPDYFPYNFLDDFDACKGHEGCIIRTVTFSDSKPLTIHAIPLDSPDLLRSSSFEIYLENKLWALSENSLAIHFSCNDSVTNFMEYDILPIEVDQPGFSSETNVEILQTNVSSNFLGLRQFRSLGNHISLNLESNITCSEKKCVCPDLSYTELSWELAELLFSFAWMFSKYSLMVTLIPFLFIIPVIFFFEWKNKKNPPFLLPSVETTNDSLGTSGGDPDRKMQRNIEKIEGS
ncbi:uncharacterized protein V1516DRAFT_667053 [Lipomyces oligophaga]|uniref:uncharacterized protein n=1 Tax=Lipomyces oligophaga TaxID=45792 RepID=UPI0034CFD1DC